MYDVTCVGILVADIFARNVEGFPENGKLQLINKIELFTGGCAASAAIDMAKLGLNAAVVGKVGFAAGFLTGLTKGWNLYECGKFANAVGSYCVMAAGASTGIKSLEETIHFMESRTI